ncbi:ABC-2 transporter permease [Stieleria sp. JC731]|uniref:ABC-2 transporter permease n=1 Tax=Pirellulaceae TaxID=2691357 RepID=UPI001E653DE6|nr:ABC-2 transporter permease [Stieleria sp. JC731]MCC9600821.1 ABC-2 transporter permease [Stieleria sp. JC731]
MNWHIYSRLLWKDYRLIRTLALAACVASLGFFLLLQFAVLTTPVSNTDVTSFAHVIWAFIPFLVAFGAPAILIGGEEESGSLKWLGTLPANWKQITHSKFIIAATCLALSWLVGSLLLWIFFKLNQYELNLRFSSEQKIAMGELLVAIGLISLSYGCLFCSLLAGYLFRSPVVGLMACIPMTVAAIWFVFGVFVQLSGANNPLPLLTEDLSLFIAIAISVAVGVCVLGYVAAWRRLTWPRRAWGLKRTPRIVWSDEVTTNAYQPPRHAGRKLGAALAGRTPSRFRALLWQSIRPVRWYLLIAAVISIGFIVQQAMGAEQYVQFPILAIIGFAVAGLTFYSDSVRGQKAFFFDRGISPRLVWFTRVLPAFCIMHLVIAAAMMEYLILWQFDAPEIVLTVYAVPMASFALAVLCSQATTRPLLNFFLGPIAVWFTGALLTLCIFMYYPRAGGLLLISAVVLLVASYRLTGLWMQRSTYSRRYLSRAWTYYAVALLIPVLVIFTFRWATMEPKDSSWRADMLSTRLPVGDGSSAWVVLPDAGTKRLRPQFWNPASTDDLQDLKEELADDSTVGQHVSMTRLLGIFTYAESFHATVLQGDTFTISRISGPGAQEYEWQLDAIRILTKWSNTVRKEIVQGNLSLNELLYVAENADWVSSLAIQSMSNEPDADWTQLKELIEGLPNQDLVRQSRRIAITRNWRQVDQKRSEYWGIVPAPPTAPWMYVERLRSSRAIDQLTQLALKQVNFGQPINDYDRAIELEKEAYIEKPVESYHRPYSPHEWLRMMRFNDRRFEYLRKQAR